ncbi:phosphate/phosphite/phosphonate ABC transporter substrate-binding protein [Rhodalgimonas zhirmunskyi]|uniref:PhnD/SsuA/transferrin family substrate-binding protein n=1 Tax=Rhodalgimonas zhirmunskyi TaxID=2964767 RepID=A0AAJ1U9I4_9RHOB|nr:PhnD/SsuA/transferrin family substrate-binding protein [Rhodoalgimonas zhirmunskyi]MDQ2092501.1 PhnD/SsuA/transferrin family substrate-binding protein [Rhodoalgimonas zhirmunskyi]
MSPAALPMYDRAEVRAANARLWTAIRDHLRLIWQQDGTPGWPLPETLSQPQDLWAHWLSPDLAFSQTCGLPLVDRLRGKVAMIGTPDYGLPDCPRGYYNSVFVMRADDARDTPADWPALRLAVNSRNSQSGWCAPQNYMAARGLSFSDVLLSGAHQRSAEAVAQGAADIACIDAQTWRMISRWDDVARDLREVGRTAPTPGLPFITAHGRDTAAPYRAIEHAIADLSKADCDLLNIRSLTRLPFASYDAVARPPFPRAQVSKHA